MGKRTRVIIQVVYNFEGKIEKWTINETSVTTDNRMVEKSEPK